MWWKMLLKNFEEIKQDLKKLNKYEVVVFGGYLSGNYRDIDICVITREKSREKNLEIWKKVIEESNYDIKVFELLPLNLKWSVIKDYKVLFGDKSEISEYFYFFRKLWGDSKHRIFDNQFENLKEQKEKREKWLKVKQQMV